MPVDLAVNKDKAALQRVYSSMTMAQLKEILRINDQNVSGRKAELVGRCVDGELHGGLPLCPRCGKGRLHMAEGVHYTCPGFWDQSAAAHKTRDFHAETVQRTPWARGVGGALQ